MINQHILLAALLLPCVAWAEDSVAPTEWSSPPNPSPHLDEAQFRWWAPEDAKTLRGILVIIPGRNGDARNAVNDAGWQALARTHDFAIVGTRLFKPDGAYQLDPDGQTTATIEKAIAELGKANGHPNAAKLPIAFWGSSAGGNTAERFALRNPRRTLAIASIKCPNGPGDATPQKTNIPILICIGKNDKEAWVKTSMENYEKGRQGRAVWTLAFHPTEGHEGGATRPLAEAFLNEVIPLRLASAGSTGLKSVSVQSAWLGDPETLEAAPATQFKGQKRRATWLPGPQSAEAWRTYLQTGHGESTGGDQL